LQAAYAMFVGKAKEGWLSLEKFTVYQGLKRAGYVLFRAEDNWHNVPVHMESAAGGKSMMQSLWALWDKTFEESEKKIRQRQATGPLVTPGLYRNYSTSNNMYFYQVQELTLGRIYLSPSPAHTLPRSSQDPSSRPSYIRKPVCTLPRLQSQCSL